MPSNDHPPTLLGEVSRSVFWNTALLPLVTAVGLLVSVLVRRTFGLESGTYDVLLGLTNSILFYSSLGLSGSLPKFLPELRAIAGRRQATRLLWRLTSARLAVLAAALVVLNVWASPLTDWFSLGSTGITYLRLLTVLIVGRAVLDLGYRAFESFFLQLRLNSLSLFNGVLDVCLIGLAIVAGWGLSGVFGALGASAAVTAVVATIALTRRLQTMRADPHVSTGADLSPSRLASFAAVTYVRDLCLYFATPAFASPALALVLGGPEPVALFATSYFVAATAVTMMVSGFRGVYRPAFASVLATGDPTLLRRSFDVMSKAQILAVVPAGVGLGVMVPDYLYLLYGQPFLQAAPVARALIGLLFAETALAIGLLVLWVDERYRPVLAAHAVLVAGTPLFLWTAGTMGLFPAAVVLGASRLASSLIGHVVAQRAYGVRYPWTFAGRVVLVSGVMAAVLQILRLAWPTSPVEAVALTALGGVIVGVGLRVGQVLGPAELDLLGRSSFPGRARLVNWLRSETARR